MTINTLDETELKPERPVPIFPENKLETVHLKSNRKPAVKKLISGESLLIIDRFQTGINLLSELKKVIFGNKSKEDFAAYRKKRSDYHDASNRLLAPVENNRIALSKSPDIGWLQKLYPDVKDFYLSFPQIQGLNSSWQWYKNGIQYPGLQQKIHPWYGVYFPTRYDHLELFDGWLKQYSGPKNKAYDIGTGSGVLAFQLLNRGFEKVFASDIHPNSIISVAENAEKLGWKDRLEIRQSDLFEQWQQKADLILFNPPWLPAQDDVTGLDKAIYYEPGLFERFFDQAEDHLNRDGKIIILFSNLAKSSGVSETHPVENELTNNGRYKKRNLLKRKVAGPSDKTKRRDHRKEEFVELWELEKTSEDDF